MNCSLQATLLQLLVFLLAGVSVSVETDSQAEKQTLERHCYSIGNCLPPEETIGSHSDQHVCQLFQDAVTCMQIAADACRKLNFPPEILARSEVMIRELRHNLELTCPDEMTGSMTSHSANSENGPEPETDRGKAGMTVVDNNNNNNINNNINNNKNNNNNNNSTAAVFSSPVLLLSACVFASSMAIFFSCPVL